MAKIDLNTVSSGYLSQAALNANFTAIENEFQNKVLYRDNPSGEPNSMQSNLDMNGYYVLNAGNTSLADADNIAYTFDDSAAETRTISDKLNEVVSVKDFGAISDCTDQGIGTDVIPAILKAVNYAVTLGSGTKVVLPPGRYRASSSAILNLNGKSFIELDFQGTITPDNIAMTVLTIRNGQFITLKASVLEGGIFNGWSDPNPFGPCNYATQRDAPAAYGQEMFLVQGVTNFTVDLCARAYAGRLLRTDERVSTSHPHTMAIKGQIKTERSTYDLSKARTAQSLWADGGTTNPNIGNWGSLDLLVCDFDYWGPVWTRLNDIEINTMDCAFANAGPTFNGCQVVTGNTWYVGDTDSSAGSRHVQFLSSGGIACSYINVNFMRFLNKGPGLWMENVFKASFSVDSLGTSFGDVCTLSNCIDIKSKVSAYGTGTRLLNISGGSTDNLNIEAVCPNGTLSEDAILIDSSVTQVIKLFPNIIVRTASKSAIKVDGAAQLKIIDPILAGTTGNIFDISSASNNVNVYNGYIDTTSVTVYKNNIKPVVIYGTSGLTDQAISSDIRSNNGGASAGDGGALQIGIAAAGFQQYSPMAQMKGQLVNSAGSELQGNLVLQIRPLGAAGQSLLDAFVASNTTTDGEMLAIVLARISGSYVAKRIKVGGTNTGPGGSGRALYVDN